MLLAKIISEVTAAHSHDGTLDRKAAITAAVPMVMKDDALVEQLIRSALSKRIKDSVCGAAERVERCGQHSFFDLRPAHALGDNESHIKETRSLTRIEFQRLIALREAQVDADVAYLKRLRAAAESTSPVWDAHPEWLWGQVEDAFAAALAAAE